MSSARLDKKKGKFCLFKIYSTYTENIRIILEKESGS